MIEMLNHLRAQPAFRTISTVSANFTAVYDWAVTADESSDNLRFFRPWLKKKTLNKVLFFLWKPDLEFRSRYCKILRDALRERANFAAAMRPQAAQKTTGTAHLIFK